MTTLIIGKNSNLSQELFKAIPDCILLSSRALCVNIDLLAPYKTEKINLIFNNFQTAIHLNDTDDMTQYVENSIAITAKILDYFKETPIVKIIYTSSSSVYGNNIFCNEHDEVKPLSLHASLKVSNEKLIETYGKNRQINYTVARIFNMYGGNDQFSIISKIISAYHSNTFLTIINNGNAIRDFIHIDDVVHAYSKILTAHELPRINIGSGEGTSVKNILLLLKNNNITVQTKNIQKDELKISTANNSIMKNILSSDHFRDVESYLMEKFRL